MENKKTGGAFSKFDFIGKRNIAFGISIASVLIFWAWVFVKGGLSYGIDFTGGIQHIFKFNRPSDAELLAAVREAALKVDPSALVQNIGKPQDGEVVIQVKGFELVEKATAAAAGSDVVNVDELRGRLAAFDLFDATFFDNLRTDTSGHMSRGKIRKVISDHVNEATAVRLKLELERRFGGSDGKIDLNLIPSGDRLFKTFQGIAVRRLATRILEKISSAVSMSDIEFALKDSGLDPKPFTDKFLLRAPTLEEIKTDLHEYSGNPDRLSAEILRLYPNAFRDAFLSSADKISARREIRGLYASVEDAAAYVEGSQADLLRDILSNSFYTGPFVLIKTDQVSSRIGAELRQKALVVVSLSLLVMLLYIWLRFEFRFGVGAIVTLLHDALTIIPLMCVLGFEYDINLIAAILTLIGYSLNDTIVVYDRIRENIASMRGASLKDIINTSIVQTLSRTVVTGITTLLAVLTLYFFGGPVLEGFSLALFLGILVGTYSSIFVSAPVVYLWPDKN